MSSESVPTNPAVAAPNRLQSAAGDHQVLGPFVLPATEDHAPSNTSNNRMLVFNAISIPEYVGDYKIERLLGSGGMGNVFQVQNQFFGRVEALKMIHDQLDSRESREAFIAEMHTQSNLDHSNIAKVHYAGVCRQAGNYRNRLYLVMSFEPRDLSEQIRDSGAFPPLEAARIVRRLAKALIHAHGKGVVHCDLKPKNILMDAEGVPKLTDFGLVKYLGTQDGATSPREGHPFGTLNYMPPEQARGERSKANERNDIYGLGAVLYELLTGQTPYSGSREEMLKRIKDLNDLPPSPRSINPRVPARLDAICMKCLQKRPLWRYQSAAELEDALDRFLRVPFWKRHWREIALAAMSLGLGAIAWNAYPSPRADAAKTEKSADAAERAGNFREARKEYETARGLLESVASSPVVFDQGEIRSRIESLRRKLETLEEKESAENRSKVHSLATTAVAESIAARQKGNRGDELRLLKDAGSHFENLDIKGDPLLAAAFIASLTRKAELHWDDRHEKDYALAIQRAEDLLKLHESNERCELAGAEVKHIKGNHFRNQNQYLLARESYEAGLNLRQKYRSKYEERDDQFCRDLSRSYGYLADLLIVTNTEPQAAEQAYSRAEQLRSALARRNPASAEAHCLHARDKANRVTIASWKGDPNEAIKSSRECVAYYKSHIPETARLPAAFLTERADNLVRTCELLFNQSGRPPSPDDLDLLESAGREYKRLSEPKEDETALQVRIGLARLELIRARFYFRLGDLPAMNRHLIVANSRFRKLEDANLVEAGDFYDMAVIHTLLSHVPRPEAERIENQVLALDRLEKAVRMNYIEYWRIESDLCLKPLEVAHPKRFAGIESDLKANLQRLREKRK